MTVEIELRDEKLTDGSVVYNLDVVQRWKDTDPVRMQLPLSNLTLDGAVAAQQKLHHWFCEHTNEVVKMYDYLRFLPA